MRLIALIVLTTSLATTTVVAQSKPGPTFDTVSIKRSTSTQLGSNVTERPDGGFTMLNVPVSFLIERAYSPSVAIDIVTFPEWATRDRYDVRTTSSMSGPTLDERTAMLRAMLADRFKLVAHIGHREQPAYDLVVARSDKRLGPSITPSKADCEFKATADRATADSDRSTAVVAPRTAIPSASEEAPPCTVVTTGPRLQGDMTMATLAKFLRPAAGRDVADKTGLAGSYRLTLTFDRPSLFTAVQQQLGLKLEPSKIAHETLIIDRLERPTEN
jgi:uncharacterized protein (TIGR03435 family)